MNIILRDRAFRMHMWNTKDFLMYFLFCECFKSRRSLLWKTTTTTWKGETKRIKNCQNVIRWVTLAILSCFQDHVDFNGVHCKYSCSQINCKGSVVKNANEVLLNKIWNKISQKKNWKPKDWTLKVTNLLKWL